MLPDDDKRYAIETCRSSESVLKKWFKINDIQLEHLLVMWYLEDENYRIKGTVMYLTYMALQKQRVTMPKYVVCLCMQKGKGMLCCWLSTGLDVTPPLYTPST